MKRLSMCLVLMLLMMNTAYADEYEAVSITQNWYNAYTSKNKIENIMSIAYLSGLAELANSHAMIKMPHINNKAISNLFMSYIESKPSVMELPTVSSFMLMCGEKGLIYNNNKKLCWFMDKYRKIKH